MGRTDVQHGEGLVIIGGRVLPTDADSPVSATAVAISAGVIVGVGSDELATRFPHARIIHAGGRTIMPGFDDAHSHVLSGARQRRNLRLRPGCDVDTMLREIRAHVETPSSSRWMSGAGWSYDSFVDQSPTNSLLDSVTGTRPTVLSSFDYHTAWVNSAALALAGIDHATPDPPRGRIGRDDDNLPNGLLYEEAADAVRDLVDLPSGADLLPLLAETQRELHSLGVTSVQDPGGELGDLAVWSQFRQSDELRLRVRLALPLPAGVSDDEWCGLLDSYASGLSAVVDDHWLSGGAVKGFVDGIVETRTAALVEPYLGEESAGEPLFAPDELARRVRAAHERGWQVQLHAIGDGAVRHAFAAFAGAQDHLAREAGGPRAPHRIEHVELCLPTDLPTFARLNVVASMQPLHADSYPDRTRQWIELVGEERTGRSWPMAQVLQAGGSVALGSDWPVASYDPLEIVRSAVSAHPRRLTVREALHAYTAHSAYAAGASELRGRIAVGFDADIILLDGDVLGPDPEAVSALEGARVAMTIVNGEVVYEG